MELRIDAHTLERAKDRGATVDELREVLATGEAVSAKYGRVAREKVYAFEKDRLGKFYPQKKVRLVYTIEAGSAVAVTVYVYYGQWED